MLYFGASKRADTLPQRDIFSCVVIELWTKYILKVFEKRESQNLLFYFCDIQIVHFLLQENKINYKINLPNPMKRNRIKHYPTCYQNETTFLSKRQLCKHVLEIASSRLVILSPKMLHQLFHRELLKKMDYFIEMITH